MEITNEIKAKVMSAYIGQKVTTPVRTYEKKGKKSQYIDGIFKEIDLGMSDFMGVLLDNEADECNYKYFNPNESQLQLTALSEITDEHAIEVLKISGYTNIKSVEIISCGVWVNFQNTGFRKFVFFNDLNSESVEQLRDLGYDYKHRLLNGQTLQQSGMAVYKTKTTE